MADNKTLGLESSYRLFDSAQHWLRKKAKVLFILALLVSTVTVMAASIQMLMIAFESQPECVPHSQSKNENQTSHRAAKSSC